MSSVVVKKCSGDATDLVWNWLASYGSGRWLKIRQTHIESLLARGSQELSNNSSFYDRRWPDFTSFFFPFFLIPSDHCWSFKLPLVCLRCHAHWSYLSKSGSTYTIMDARNTRHKLIILFQQILVMGYRVPVGKRAFHHLSAAICFTASVAYFAMGTFSSHSYSRRLWLTLLVFFLLQLLI